ncbi:phage tail tape measure protein [Nesterenkonia sp. CF4.4]|uniref:phage tail tape measure protein n=1 Tax=Nesterenkonia sp. CF4.4 TaxID=3373079 RepID=UPI003EE6B09A
MKTAQRAATDAGKQLDSFRRNNEQTWNAAGRGAIAFGTAAVAGMGFAAKAASDWESAWAGVTKTVDGSPEQMAALEEELRNLATTLPLTHAEIAGIAEAAGQLGIAREDITGFTKTMVDLGVSTNLTAEEAATSIAQMMNVMRTAPEDVDNLGSALVALGNNGASTEKDILMMAQRLAGTGQLIGASEGEVLALSNTLASLGISAEAGGGAMSRVMQDIYTSVQDGGESLEGFAEVAGMTAQEFSTAFQADPIAAVDAFTQGLGRIGEEGGNVVGTLSELGIKSTEETRALLAMAGASGMLADDLKLQGEAWEANTALTEEAGKRYAVTEERVKIAWNGIKDAAIDAGAVLLPMIAGTAESIADLAGVFSSFSPEAQSAITVLGGLAGVGAVAGGGLMLLLPKMQESSRALRSLGKGGEIADRGLRKVGKGAAAAGAIGAVGLALAKIVEADYMNDIDDGMGRVSETLIDLANDAPGAGVALDELFQNIDGEAITGEVDSIDDALRRTFDKDKGEKFNDWAENIINGVTGIEGSSQILEGSWDRMDQGLAALVSEGNTEEAARAFAEIQEAAEAQGVSVEQLAAIFPLYGDALSGAAAEQSTAAGSGEELQTALGDVGLAADGTVESLGDFIDKMFESGLATMTAREASARFQESIDAADAAVQQIIESQGAMGATLNQSKTDFDLTTEAGRLANGAFQDITRSGFDAATAMAENGASQDEVQGKLRSTYDSLLTAAEGFGLSEAKARDLAREVLGVPDGVTVDSWMSTEAENTAENLKESIDNVPNSKEVSSWMSDKAFQTALETRAAILGIPPEDVVSSFMSSAARDEADATTAEVLGIPPGASISSFMEDDAKVEAWATQAALDRIDTQKTIRITTIRDFVQGSLNNASSPLPSWANPGGATGGRAGRDFGYPKLRNGGRLPYTGLGTDMILGVNSQGRPIADVDDGEWVIRERSANKYDSVLDRINRDHPSVQHLAGYAEGGRVNSGAHQAQQMVMAAAPPQQAAAGAAGPSLEDMPAMMNSAVRDAIQGAQLKLGFGHEAVLAKVVRVGEKKISRL